MFLFIRTFPQSLERGAPKKLKKSLVKVLTTSKLSVECAPLVAQQRTFFNKTNSR
jgi:hypothetical protein